MPLPWSAGTWALGKSSAKTVQWSSCLSKKNTKNQETKRMKQETHNNGTNKNKIEQNKKQKQQQKQKATIYCLLMALEREIYCLRLRSLYRGLIFGDGAGLDNMGFAIEGSWRGESSLAKVTDDRCFRNQVG